MPSASLDRHSSKAKHQAHNGSSRPMDTWSSKRQIRTRRTEVKREAQQMGLLEALVCLKAA